MDINEGESVSHAYPSRLVAKELKMDKRLGLIAATLPLEAKKALFSAAVTEGLGHKQRDWYSGMKLDFIGISHAFSRLTQSESRTCIYQLKTQKLACAAS